MSTITMSTQTPKQPLNTLINKPQSTITPTPIQPQLPQLKFTTNRYRLRCTAHQLYLNDQPIPYSQQILNMDKFYIIKTQPNSQLKTPIILHRNKQIDTLDRRVFTKKFVFEIVKSLQICSFSDAVFICERIPKQLKYFVHVIQGVTLFRWKILLMNDFFYITFYSCLESLITKKSLMSPLRKDMLEDLLKTKIMNSYSRLFYMMDNLVLQNQDLRYTITNLGKNIVLEQIQKNNFFQCYLLGKDGRKQNEQMLEQSKESSDCQQQSQGENSGIEDNLSSTDRSLNIELQVSQKKRVDDNLLLTHCPQNLLQNTINITRSAFKIKLSKQLICKKILNKQLLTIIRQFFKQYFQTKRQLLMQVLQIMLQLQPILMWEVIFEEGKNWKNRNLKFLQVMIVSEIKINLENDVNGKIGIKNQSSLSLGLQFIKGNFMSNIPANANNLITSDLFPHKNLSHVSFIIIQKLLTLIPPSLQQRQFITRIITNSILASNKLTKQQLQFLLVYFQVSLRDINNTQISDDFFKSMKQLWKLLVKRMETLLIGLKNKLKYEVQRWQVHVDEIKLKSNSINRNNTKINVQKTNPDRRQNNNDLQQNRPKIYSNKYNLLSTIHLPLPKLSLITLLKIYKILIKNERQLSLELNLECVDYLLSMTRNRKGMIEGVRLELIEQIEKEETMREEVSLSR